MLSTVCLCACVITAWFSSCWFHFSSLCVWSKSCIYFGCSCFCLHVLNFLIEWSWCLICANSLLCYSVWLSWHHVSFSVLLTVVDVYCFSSLDLTLDWHHVQSNRKKDRCHAPFTELNVETKHEKNKMGNPDHSCINSWWCKNGPSLVCIKKNVKVHFLFVCSEWLWGTVV